MRQKPAVDRALPRHAPDESLAFAMMFSTCTTSHGSTGAGAPSRTDAATPAQNATYDPRSVRTGARSSPTWSVPRDRSDSSPHPCT